MGCPSRILIPHFALTSKWSDLPLSILLSWEGKQKKALAGVLTRPSLRSLPFQDSAQGTRHKAHIRLARAHKVVYSWAGFNIFCGTLVGHSRVKIVSSEMANPWKYTH